MKLIPLSRGLFAMVDDDDFERVSEYAWHAEKCMNLMYASHTFPRLVDGKKTGMRMHRFIMGAKTGQVVDHKDRNTLNNQKSNLRICTQAQNQANKKLQANNTSGAKGVRFSQCANKWVARVVHKGVEKHIGCFSDFESAVNAREQEAMRLQGKFYRRE